jgi:V8-like Glu-specific endopeptidase
VFEPPGALRLRHLSGPQRGTTVVLRPPRSRIGRSRSNDIILADREGAASSGQHAEAVRLGRQWFIHDLGSSNGTLLNGQRVTRAPFGPGDRLRFGDVECEVLPGRFTPVVVGAAATAALLVLAIVLWRGASPRFEDVANRIAQSVYMVAVDTPDGRHVVGTAFVVGDRLLATNAHVADVLQASPDAPPRAVVIRSDSEIEQWVTDVYVSAAWRDGSIADDVALLRVSALAADSPPLRLADDGTLAALTRGRSLATFGFPANGTDPKRPRGRLSVDVLGDVRDGRYLAVGLRIAPGTSGSPIFLPDGVVIGLVAGGDFVESPAGEKSPTGTNVNWGITVTPLQQLIRECTAAER